MPRARIAVHMPGGELAGARFRLPPSGRVLPSSPRQARQTRSHVGAMAAAALTTLLSVALGIGIPVALAMARPVPRLGQPGVIATAVETYASLDGEHAAGKPEECIGCR
jgi:hypothetical protein